MRYIIFGLCAQFGFLIVMARLITLPKQSWERLGRLWQWFRVKRVCKWCHRPHRMAGSPLAWKVSHGICQDVFIRTCVEHCLPIPPGKLPRKM